MSSNQPWAVKTAKAGGGSRLYYCASLDDAEALVILTLDAERTLENYLHAVGTVSVLHDECGTGCYVLEKGRASRIWARSLIAEEVSL